MFELRSFDYIVDALGTLSSKLLLISRAAEARVPVISCMDMGINWIRPDLKLRISAERRYAR